LNGRVAQLFGARLHIFKISRPRFNFDVGWQGLGFLFVVL
jgi:hypothetical protein